MTELGWFVFPIFVKFLLVDCCIGLVDLIGLLLWLDTTPISMSGRLSLSLLSSIIVTSLVTFFDLASSIVIISLSLFKLYY